MAQTAMRQTRRGFLATGMATGVAAAFLARSAEAGAGVIHGRAFGSTWRLVGQGGDPARIAAAVGGIVAEVDAAMSPYLAGSALSRFNAGVAGRWREVPPGLGHVAGAALALARFTGGAFDPTVGPVVHRFGFGPITGARGRFQDIGVKAGALSKSAPGLTLDLCGIAKGYALDRAVGALRAAGMSDFLLEVGGELSGHGRHPGGRPWRVAIEDPYLAGPGAACIVEPGARALATSGHRANGLTGPIATSHIIDPHRARPAAAFAGSVSVLAATAMEADALATALAAMGAAGVGFARRHGIAALFIRERSGAGARIMTGDFADRVVA